MPEIQTPDLQSPTIKAMMPKVARFRDVCAGTDRMREARERYLPRFEREDRDDYDRRLSEANLYNATGRTQEALVGMVLRKDPQLHPDLPQPLLKAVENVDLAGRHLSVFARSHFTDAWDGLACILVDKQRPSQPFASLAEERAAGLRPYWVNIRLSDILRARTLVVNGRTVLGRFAYMECATEDDGEYGEKEVRRVREFHLLITGARAEVMYTVHAEIKGEGGRTEWVLVDDGALERVKGAGKETWDEIPVAVTYTGWEGPFRASPPLDDLALENIDHYQQRSEHREAWRYARIPVPVFSGIARLDDVVMAANRAVLLPSADASAVYMQANADNARESAEELRECERRMAVLGASMLYNSQQVQQTATERRIEKGESDSRVAVAARGLQDCLEEALRLHAKWEGLHERMPALKTDARWVTVSKEFEEYEMDAQMIGALNKAVGDGNITLKSFLTALRDGTKWLAFLDPETEAEKLAGTGMAPPDIAPRRPPTNPTDVEDAA